MHKAINVLILAIALVQVVFTSGISQNTADAISVTKIYSDSNYNAFTSLVKFNGKFYCAFRSGERHVYGRDGVIKVISSSDGKTWEPVATISKKGYDLRDPKLSITPNGRMLVNMGGSVYQEKKLMAAISHISISNKRGTSFSSPKPIRLKSKRSADHLWLWRLTWHEGTGYGGIYFIDQRSTSDSASIQLVKTTNGRDYQKVTELKLAGKPSESTIRFQPDGEMIMLIRNDLGDKKAYVGRSKAPYLHWNIIKLPVSVGGPDFIGLSDGYFIGGGRINGKYTGLFRFTRTGEFREMKKLPSNADSSYPGFVIEKGSLYVSYYSSHETPKTAIYFAKIPLDLLVPK